MDKQFTMSMYASGEALYKAKAEYYMDEIAALKARERMMLEALESVEIEIDEKIRDRYPDDSIAIDSCNLAFRMVKRVISSNPNTKLYKAQSDAISALECIAKDASNPRLSYELLYHGCRGVAKETLERIEQEMK